ncbi:hypothetical protein DFJ58DRAFT_846836 [Suillus subalutaceus]|uniref:uncharacterized protein n=1 Tax=Suillus subalutaceus TaxID=48586 RepID=UPI001B86F054|nr:uncharacterized protein DFJ58DRAFT_846836 [Suillus subalutaceus]KAG1836687.1 hypothetical protein DFJ58DRAFT_846836 [Suillus subalutaceus]
MIEAELTAIQAIGNKPYKSIAAAAKEQNGPSSELISHIHHLAELLKNLPTVLPLDPSSSQYGFGLDPELIEEEGKQYEVLIQMFKLAVKKLEKDSKREFLHEVWLERLIMATKIQGAKIPVKMSALVLKNGQKPNVRSLHKVVHLRASWRSAKVHQMVLTFDDLRWKPLETEREKKLQWERLDALTRESWEKKKMRKKKNSWSENGVNMKEQLNSNAITVSAKELLLPLKRDKMNHLSIRCSGAVSIRFTLEGSVKQNMWWNKAGMAQADKLVSPSPLGSY